MAATGNLVINGNVSNVNGNSQTTIGPTTVTSATAYALSESLTLTSGANTVTLPTGMTVLTIIGANGANPKPNPTSIVTLTLKGNSSDTGVPISNTYPTTLVWDLATAPSSIIITASGSTTVQLWGF